MIPTIETERLIMRAPSVNDLQTEAAFYKTERSKFVGGPANEAGVWNMIAMMLGHWHINGYGFWGVEDKNTGEYYGRVGLWMPYGWPEPELGWTVMGNAEGKGIAYEAALTARNYAYTTLNWTTVISFIGLDNLRSIKLAERLGCVFEKAHPVAADGAKFAWRHPSADEVRP